jgi:hypothetical protein
MIFTPGVHTLALAAFADRGAPLFEVHSSVINRWNYNFTSAIRETVLPVSDNPDKPVVEPVSPVVHRRDTAYHDLAPAVDVHPACFSRVHSGQTMCIETQFLQILRRDEEFSRLTFAYTVWNFTTFAIE